MKFLNIRRLILSFNYAAKGVIEVFKAEQNIRIHLFSALLVIVAMFYFRTSNLEKAILVLAIVLVFLAETINSILERVVDILRPRLHPEAKTIKDIMAAMVLISAFGAVVIGAIIFIPKIIVKAQGLL